MTDRYGEHGAEGPDDAAARVAALLTRFQERMDRLENGLSAQVDRVRGSAEAIDMLTDEVRRSLQTWQEDGVVAARLSEIERTLARPAPAPVAPEIDLAPVTSALAEVLEAVALQSETARTDRQALQDEVETLRAELREVPEPIDLSELHDHLDQLAQHVTASAPRPVDLGGVTSSIVGLHQRIDALLARPDIDLGPLEDRLSSIPDRAQVDELQARLGSLDGRIDETRADLSPVLDRLDALAETIDTHRPEPVDLTPLSAAIADLRTHIADGHPDLTPMQNALAEVVDALAQQIDDSRSSSASALAAIEVLADRVRESRTDLEPVEQRLGALADSQQVDDLGRRVDDLAQTIAAQQPEPIDLTPLSAAIADLRTHIADSRPDLAPLRTRLDELAAEVRDGRVDLAPVHERLATVAHAEQIDTLRQRVDEVATLAAQQPEPIDLTPLSAAIADLRTHIADGRPDFSPLHARLDELTAASDTHELRGRLDEVGRTVDGLDSRLDLTPMQNALAEVVDALAQQIDDSRSSSASALAAIEVLADRVRESRTDLEPVEQRLDALADSQQLEDLGRRVDDLAQTIAAQQPEAIDLTPLSAAIADLRTHIADSRPDLAPLRTRLDELATEVRDGRVDLAPVHERLATVANAEQIDTLRQRVDDVATLAAQQPEPVDLTPMQNALAEVVDALAQQIDDSRSSSASALAAIEVLADRVRESRTDLEPVEQRLDELATEVRDGRVDLAPVHERLATVANAEQIDTLRQRVDDVATLAAQQPEPVDLTPLSVAIADLRTHIADSRPDLDALRASIDLGSIRSGIAEVVEASVLQLETTERTAAELRAAISAAARDGAVDLTPVVGAVDALRHHYDQTQPDLEALVEAMKAMRAQIISGVHEAADANRIDLQPLLDGIEAQRSAQESLLERVRADLAQLETSTHADGEQTRAAIEHVAQVATTPPDLGPVLEAVDGIRTSIPRVDLQPVEERLESLAASMPSVDLGPVLQAVAELGEALPPTVDLTPVHQAITDLRAAVPPAADLTPVLDAVAEVGGSVPPPADLEPIRRAIADLAAALPPAADLDPVRDDLASLRQSLGAEIEGVREQIDGVHAAMPTVDLAPIVAAVEAVRQDMPTVDLDPVLRAVESVHGDLPTIDLDSVLRAVESVHGDLPTIDLDPVLRAVESVHADLPSVELEPVLDAVENVRRALPEIDLARLYAQLADLAAKVDAIDTTVDLEPVHEDLDAVRTTVREAEVDLTPVLERLSDLGRRVDDTSEVERLRAAIDRVADDVASGRAESARAEMIDQLAQRLDSLQAAVESIRADDALRDTELRLSRRVDANSESLRAKIDDQRALADGLAANVSQLNAALTLASEQPQQLRRDLDRTLEQLAERLGGAMRDLRKELDSADEPLALRSSVEAGLDRITGRFQTDTSRILEAVAAAQEDADGRLRRIDNQMTELRRAVDRARRETERLEGAPSS